MDRRLRRSDVSVDIDRSPAVVWDFVTDLRRTPEWRTTIRSIEPPDELLVGASFTASTRLLGRTWHWELEVTAVEPHHRFGYVVTRGVATPTVEYRVDPGPDGGTSFTLSGWIRPTRWAVRALVPLAQLALRRESRIHLERLRSLLESPDGAIDP